MAQPIYDVIIVGAGLYGSAAARHMALLDGAAKVLLIGPDEPEVKLLVV